MITPGRYKKVAWGTYPMMLCSECSTRSTGVLVPVKELRAHERWHATPRCWNCERDTMLIERDPTMKGLTDRCVCLACGEPQDDSTFEAVALLRSKSNHPAGKDRDDRH